MITVSCIQREESGGRGREEGRWRDVMGDGERTDGGRRGREVERRERWREKKERGGRGGRDEERKRLRGTRGDEGDKEEI